MPEAVLAEPWVDEPPPPTQEELPCDDGEPMETQRHQWQMDILIDALDRWLEVVLGLTAARAPLPQTRVST